MAIFRTIKTGFWTDEKVIDEFSPEDRYFFLYLLTNPETTQLGIYKFVPRTAAFYLGYSKEAVMVLLDRFENKYNLIRYSYGTNEIAIKNFLKHSVIKGGKPVADCLEREEANVKNKDLVLYIVNHLQNEETLLNTVKAFIEKMKVKYGFIKNENENENDNENENENDSYEDVTPTVTPTLRKKKPVKHKYGEYNNVLLTDEEYEKLQELFPDTQDRIERLSEYVASTGKSYKSHYATIRAWARKDQKPANKASQELDDFYSMTAEWARSRGEG